MCLIVFDYQPDTPQPLRLAANRDEFYHRPSKIAHRWAEAPGVVAGRDLEMGGTWMGMSETGKFAAVTNFREIPTSAALHSRGKLTADFLTGDELAENYLAQLSHRAQDFAGFNLLLGDHLGLYYFSNRQGRIRRLSAGLYGLSNHLLDTPWPKLEWAKQKLTDAQNHRQLQSLLTCRQVPDDVQLPNTGIGLEWERLLGSCFIQSEKYGTRTCSSIIIESNGQASLQEQHFGPFGQPLENNALQLKLSTAWHHRD